MFIGNFPLMNGPEKESDFQKTKLLLGGLSPYKILSESLARVPGLRILFGVVAVLAIIAIARVWSLDRGWTIVGGIAVVVFAIVLLVLAKLSSMQAAAFRLP